MKEMDDIERLFNGAFGEGEITPPESVKKAIDKELFPARSVSRKWYLLSLVLIVFTSSTLIYLNYSGKKNSNSDNKNNQFSTLQESESQITVNNSNSKSAKENLTIDNSNSTVTKSVASPNSNVEYINESGLKLSSNDQLDSQKIKTQQNSANNKSRKINTLTIQKDNDKPNIDESNSDSKTNENIATNNKDSGNAFDIQNKKDNVDVGEIDILKSLAIFKLPVLVHEIYPGTLTSQTAKIKSSIPLSFSLYSGPTFGINTIDLKKQTFAAERLTVDEKRGYSISVETQYKLNDRFNISAGVEYAERTDNYNLDYDKAIFSYLGDSTSIVLDSNGMAMDTLYYPKYGYISQATTENTSYKYSGLCIPLYFSFHKTIGISNWSIYTIGGMKLSYVNYVMKSEDTNMPNVTVNHFGLSAGLRPEIRYTINQFSLGAYLRFGYDIRSGIIIDNAERRRIDLGTGLSFTYHL